MNRKRETFVAIVFLCASLLGARFTEAHARSSDSDRCAQAPSSSLVINTKDKGAKGDGRRDDTAAIQAAIDEVAGTGGTVFVPEGTYMVNAVGKDRLMLKSNMILKLSRGATLKAIPNGSRHYSVLSISDASNVTVVGGTLVGDRHEHAGEKGEWGMGIRIDRGASHITIYGVISKNMWGDGFYVDHAKDVRFCSVTADNNRRQGLSIIDVDGLVVTDSVFKNTGGTRPGAGIDLEPDKRAQKIMNVQIRNSQFFDNAGMGILVFGGRRPLANIKITNNLFSGNRPIKIKRARFVHGLEICRNRQIKYQSKLAAWLFPFATHRKFIVAQRDCQDRRLEVYR